MASLALTQNDELPPETALTEAFTAFRGKIAAMFSALHSASGSLGQQPGAVPLEALDTSRISVATAAALGSGEQVHRALLRAEEHQRAQRHIVKAAAALERKRARLRGFAESCSSAAARLKATMHAEASAIAEAEALLRGNGTGRHLSTDDLLRYAHRISFTTAGPNVLPCVPPMPMEQAMKLSVLHGKAAAGEGIDATAAPSSSTASQVSAPAPTAAPPPPAAPTTARASSKRKREDDEGVGGGEDTPAQAANGDGHADTQAKRMKLAAPKQDEDAADTEEQRPPPPPMRPARAPGAVAAAAAAAAAAAKKEKKKKKDDADDKIDLMSGFMDSSSEDDSD